MSRTLRSRGIVLGMVSAALLLASAPATSAATATTATTAGALASTSTPAVVVQAWLSNSWITKPGTAWVLDRRTVLVSGSVVLVPPGGVVGTPAPPGRQVSLQQRAGQRWRTLTTARTDRNHMATFGIIAPVAGLFRLATAGGTSETFAVHRAPVGFAALSAQWSVASATPNAPGAEVRVCLLGAPPGNVTSKQVLLQRHDSRGWHTTASRTTAKSYDSSRCGAGIQFWAPKGTGTFRLVVPRWGLTIAHIYGRAS